MNSWVRDLICSTSPWQLQQNARLIGLLCTTKVTPSQTPRMLGSPSKQMPFRMIPRTCDQPDEDCTLPSLTIGMESTHEGRVDC